MNFYGEAHFLNTKSMGNPQLVNQSGYFDVWNGMNLKTFRPLKNYSSHTNFHVQLVSHTSSYKCTPKLPGRPTLVVSLAEMPVFSRFKWSLYGKAYAFECNLQLIQAGFQRVLKLQKTTGWV